MASTDGTAARSAGSAGSGAGAGAAPSPMTAITRTRSQSPVAEVAAALSAAARSPSPPFPKSPVDVQAKVPPHPVIFTQSPKHPSKSKKKKKSNRVAPAPASAPVAVRTLRKDASSSLARPKSATSVGKSGRWATGGDTAAAAARPQVHVATFDTGHYLSPGRSTRGLRTEGSVMQHPGSSSILTESFNSPTSQGMRRSTSAIFPRARREMDLASATSPSIASSTCGGMGSKAPLSRLRNAPAFSLPSSTREGESMRWRQRDSTADKHGPADYVVSDRHVTAHRPHATIGSASRDHGRVESLGPGPAVLRPQSALRQNRSALFGSARRKGLVEHQLGGPGPSSYVPSPIRLAKTPSAHFGSSRRRSIRQSDAPGVGAYRVSGSTFVSGFGKRAPSFGFSTARRF